MKIGLKTPLCLSGHQIDRLLLENWFHREKAAKKDLRICSSLWRNMLPSASWCGRDPITIGGLWAPNCHQQSRSDQGSTTYPGQTHHKNPLKSCAWNRVAWKFTKNQDRRWSVGNLGESFRMCFAFSYTLRLAQFFTPRVDSCLDLDFR